MNVWQIFYSFAEEEWQVCCTAATSSHEARENFCKDFGNRYVIHKIEQVTK